MLFPLSCLRLSLTSFAYLWQREQSSLLHDMITSKFEAVVVKVAAMGLKPSLHLGRTIEQLENDFQALVLLRLNRIKCSDCRFR